MHGVLGSPMALQGRQPRALGSLTSVRISACARFSEESTVVCSSALYLMQQIDHFISQEIKAMTWVQ